MQAHIEAISKFVKGVLVNKNISYEEARKIVWNLNLRNLGEWILYQQEHNLPGLPLDPRQAYGERYISDSDWIGFYGNFWCYSRAKLFVSGLNIRSMAEWWMARKNGACPATIPSNPNTVYLNEWRDWPSFLGYEKVSYVSYKKAKELVSSLNLATMSEFKKWWRENDGQSLGLPLTPNSVYKMCGWEGSKSFLGYSKRRSNSRQYLNFDDACDFMRKQNLSSHAEWIAWCRMESRPRNIPSAPDVKYASEWRGFPHFLGYDYEYPEGRMRNSRRVKVRSYEDAKDFIQAKKFSSQAEFAQWAKTADRPIDFPSSPNRKYRDSGWEGYAKFLGYFVEKAPEVEGGLDIIGAIGGIFISPERALLNAIDLSLRNEANQRFNFI